MFVYIASPHIIYIYIYIYGSYLRLQAVIRQLVKLSHQTRGFCIGMQ